MSISVLIQVMCVDSAKILLTSGFKIRIYSYESTYPLILYYLWFNSSELQIYNPMRTGYNSDAHRMQFPCASEYIPVRTGIIKDTFEKTNSYVSLN